MSLEKICNLYASDFHLCTILFPFVRKNMEEGKEVINIFENNLEKNVKTIINKIKIEKELKDNLSKIEWNKKEININMQKELKNFANEKGKIIFINGTSKYINTMNENIEKWISENNLEKSDIKIVHCYNIEKNEDNIKNIINTYPKILTTTGEQINKKVYSHI